MGCDGGSIPKRKEIVKNKQGERQPHKDTDLASKWLYCAISGMPLSKPIVSGDYGHLFNKEAAIEFILDLKKGSSRPLDLRSTIKCLHSLNSMRDLKELNLKEIADEDLSESSTSHDVDTFQAKYVCPVAGLHMNGRYKFVFSWQCGCVISERALKEVPNDGKCIVCQKPYNEQDLVVINPDEDELRLNTAKMVTRKIPKEPKRKGNSRRPEDIEASCSSSASRSKLTNCSFYKFSSTSDSSPTKSCSSTQSSSKRQRT